MPHYDVQVESGYEIRVEADGHEAAAIRAQRGEGLITRNRSSVDIHGPYGDEDNSNGKVFRPIVITSGEEV